MLKSSKHSRKGVSYMFLHEWLGTGLLTSAGAKWKLRYRTSLASVWVYAPANLSTSPSLLSVHGGIGAV